MKRLLLALACLALLLTPVAAQSLTFQSQSDFTTYMNATGSPTPYYVGSTTAGNGYVDVPVAAVTLKNKVGSPFTYTAYTDANPATQYKYFALLDGNMATQYTFNILDSTASPRMEISVVGGTAYVYINGILAANSTLLTQNPSYIRWGGARNPYVDDLIMGSSESKYIVGMPETNAYFIKKDMVNPSASGLYNMTTGALVDSNYMYTTWGRSNITYAGNESIYLEHVETGTVYETHYTGTGSSGTITWDIGSSIIAANAPYGRYRVHFGDYYSDEIAYIANGASISFDKATYNQGNTAIMTYTVDGSYWDTSTYTYYLKLYEGTYWTEKYSTGLTASSGSATYTFTSDDLQGEYYAVIEAHPNAGGDAIWMNYDYAALSTYFALYGYVMSAQNATVLSGANVSITQNGIISNQITIADGNYTTDGTGFLSGVPLTVNVTRSGYHQYLATFTPQTAGTKYVNISLNATSPTNTGPAIGGIIRTGIFDGTTITKGYGQPIGSATCHARNATDGLTCSNTSGLAGWYLFDEGNGCILTTAHIYDIWCDKTGYSNSPNYTVVAA